MVIGLVLVESNFSACQACAIGSIEVGGEMSKFTAISDFKAAPSTKCTDLVIGGHRSNRSAARQTKQNKRSDIHQSGTKSCRSSHRSHTDRATGWRWRLGTARALDTLRHVKHPCWLVDGAGLIVIITIILHDRACPLRISPPLRRLYVCWRRRQTVSRLVTQKCCRASQIHPRPASNSALWRRAESIV
jgi:hypothetical protein